jgi:hypothetical protein
MQQLGQIDALAQASSPLTERQRQKLSERHKQLEREQGYEQLRQLCYLGEYDAAKHLVRRHPSWEYEIVDGEVIEARKEE